MIDVTFNDEDDESGSEAEDNCGGVDNGETGVKASTEFVDLSDPSSLTNLEQ